MSIKNYRIELDERAERDDGIIFTDYEVRVALIQKGFENAELEWMRCTVKDVKTVLTELPKIVPTNGHSIASTWAIAARPQPKHLWPSECFIWEAKDPYLYVRATLDGRVICGGEDEEFADETRRDAKLDRKTKVLEKKLARLLPMIDPCADFAWTASFGQSKTGLPSVGPLPGHPRCYGVLGYGGNGITYSMLASQLVSASIAGRKDADAKLYAFR